MLQKKNTFSKGDVVVVKVTAMEEVIGKVVDGDGTGPMTLTDALLVQPMRDGQGQIHLSFFPYSLTAEEKHNFVIENYCSVFVPRKDVKDAFLQQTSSIELPEKSGLILPK